MMTFAKVMAEYDLRQSPLNRFPQSESPRIRAASFSSRLIQLVQRMFRQPATAK
jgi:hypothetical protein